MFDVPQFEMSAKDMGDAIATVADKLFEFEIVTGNGYSVLREEAGRLKGARDSKEWMLQISRENAVEFEFALDKNNEIIIPSITCEGLHVVQNDHSRPPFKALDIAIEIFDADRIPVARWHVDWANVVNGKPQAGPLVHLQYGGHFAGHRALDPKVKEPRWVHPPMDLILMCEVTAANFHEEKWEALREDNNWCQAVAIGQRFCYSAYLRKICQGLSVSSKTLLHSMWASEWHENK